jgi:hypothetical protein
MKKILLPLFALVCQQTFGQVNLWSDNFNTANGPLDSSSLAGRLSGLAAGETYMQSFGTEQSIENDQLALATSGGVRFGGQTSRYDWAGATTGPSILAAGGFNVSFDWTTIDNTDTEWIGLKVGTPDNDSHISDGDIDNAILMRKNGGTQIFDDGAGSAGNNFTTISGGGTYAVSLTYTFSSFANGSLVDVVAEVNGDTIADSSFTWNQNGSLYMDLEGDSTGNTISDFAITTLAPVPEPSTALLGLVGGCAVLIWRRRH